MLLLDHTIYPLVNALARASLVPEFKISEGSAGIFDVLASFNAALASSQGMDLESSAADAVLVGESPVPHVSQATEY